MASVNVSENVMKEVENDLISYYMSFDEELAKIMKKVIDYNMEGGKKLRGRMVLHTFKNILKMPSENNLKQCTIIACCVELLETGILIADDLYDNGELRRGKLCWYKLEPKSIIHHIQLMFDSCTYIIRKRLRSHEQFVNILELFEDVKYIVLHSVSAENAAAKYLVNNSDFPIDKYESIAIMKAYYTICFPTKLGVLMANVSSEELNMAIDDVGKIIGLYFQVQDDYFDVFGDENITGKKGTDIQEGKCSWFVANAIPLMTDEQKIEFRENFKQVGEGSINKVRSIFVNLSLPEENKLYLESLRKNIIEKLDEMFSKHIEVSMSLFAIFEIIQRRQK